MIATFEGSKSYWPSSARAAFAVYPAPPAPAEPEPPSMKDTYVQGIGAAIIVAIAIVGAIIIIVVRKSP